MRIKAYVAFDHTNARQHYDVMRLWDEEEESAIIFADSYGVKLNAEGFSEEECRALLVKAISDASVVLCLVDEHTCYPFKYLAMEIELAITLAKPIIVVNLNGSRVPDSACCPVALQKALALHVPFNQKIVKYAIEKWPTDFLRFKSGNARLTAYYYSDSFYGKMNNA